MRESCPAPPWCRARPETSLQVGAPARPGPGVLLVFAGLGSFAELQRTEGVDHDGGFVEPLCPQRRLDRTGLWSVRNTRWVQRHRPELDARALARLVVATDVEHELVGVHVCVV